MFQVRTNKGRIRSFGEQPRPQWRPKKSADLVYKQKKWGQRLYIEIVQESVRSVAFDTRIPHDLPVPALPEPKSTFLDVNTSVEPFFYSSALLDGVVAITPSRKLYKNGNQVVTGLLLEDDQRNQTTLGQVRLDSLGETWTDMDGIRIQFVIDVNNYPQVSRVQAFKGKAVNNKDDEKQLTMECELKGHIEWWFSWRQCRVYHGDKSSPATYSEGAIL